MNEMSENVDVDWNDLQLFLAVAREGGLSAAAKSCQRSAATLGRRMHMLERALGKELFARHDRGYELLAEGKVLLQALTEIESRIHDLTPSPDRDLRPLVKISAGTWTTLFLIQRLDKLSEPLSGIRLRFVSTEKVLDIAHREVVLGIRNHRPIEPTLACRKLAQVEFAPYATDSEQTLWIKVLADIPSAQWLDRVVCNDAICEVNVPRNSLDLALAGQGIALLPTFIGDAEPSLHRVGDTIEALGHDQWMVTHQDDRYLPEVRQLIDKICDVLTG
ncbi:LysR family transcriptional regulator [Enterovibrio calviensis]|uniref:LysR family transcriptional regulator n=1 Tax=Enterovibrio calviensis TaxID=91359 RepID=UPI000A9E9A11|nr:LysR family transcriptional regulator [Enterovibrio calviensis]